MEKLMLEHSLRCPILGDIMDQMHQYPTAREETQPIMGGIDMQSNTHRVPAINL
jgi:hypothetical protein